MSNYNTVKTQIQNAIYSNNEKAITGNVLQEQLLNIVNTLISGGYLYAGVAKLTPTQTNPGSPDANVFYIATEPGTYTNFVGAGGSLVVAKGEVAIFKFNGTWSKEVTGAATAAQVTELGQKLDLISKTGATELSANTDLNNVTTFGIYGFTSAIAQTLINIPFIGGGYLVVESSTPTTTQAFKQTLYFGLSKQYVRFYSTVDGFTKWECYSDEIRFVKNALEKTSGVFVPIEEQSGYLKPDGTFVSASEARIKKYDISGYNIIFITGRQGGNSNYALAAFYDTTGVFISAIIGTLGTNYYSYGVNVPENAKYVRVCSSSIAYQPNIDCVSFRASNLFSKTPSYVIKANDDLNQKTEYGIYSCLPDVARTIKNTPIWGGFYLLVERSTPTGAQYIRQTMVCGQSLVYTRFYSSLGWSAWISIEKINSALAEFSGKLIDCGTFDGALSPDGTINSAYEALVKTFYVKGVGRVYITGRQGGDLSMYALYAFYDADGNYIDSSAFVGQASTNYVDYPVNVPANAKYIKVCSSSTAYQPLVECKISENEYEIPIYWKSYIDSKIGTINEKVYGIGGTGDNFVFITDIHEDYNNGVSPDLIKYILDKTSIRNIVIGGDLYTSASTQAAALAYLQGVKNKYNFTDRVFAIRGNHDSGNSITEGQYYSIFDRPLENILTTLEAGKSYFYRDNDAQKIRYIFCDCPNYQSAMPNDQITWLQARITELAAGWTIVIFAHAYWNATAIGSSEEITTYGTSLRNAISSVAGTANATIAALIVGHTHADRSEQTSTGYWIISTTCDAGGALASTYDPVTPTRTPGTTLEQAFDVFNINTNTRVIYATRIGGNGADRQFSY